MAKNSENQLLFKASLFSLTILYCQDKDINQFAAKLKQSVKQSPKFFQHAPILLDIEQLKAAEIQFDGIIDLLRHYEMIPVGVRGGTAAQQQQAIDFGLAIFPLTQQEKEKISPTSYKPAKIIQQPVRSGQQVYAQNSDLIIIGTVSDGAEVLADGNIHVYGTLRGRALAGVAGDKNARIFCHQLEAQLVSIAGHYLVYEHKPAFDNDNKTIQIYLDGEHLQIKSL